MGDDSSVSKDDITAILRGSKLLEEHEFSQSLSDLFEAQRGQHEITEGHTVDILREFYYKRLAELCKSLETANTHPKPPDPPTLLNPGLVKPPLPGDDHSTLQDGQEWTSSSGTSFWKALEETTGILRSYYDAINGGVWDDDELNKMLSRAYLEGNKWPKASKVLEGIQKDSEEFQRRLELLEARDEMCKNIIAVQHCIIMSRHPGHKSVSTEPPKATEGDTSLEATMAENRKLLQRIELYKSELMRIYGK